MATCAAFQVQMASVMEVLTKTALAEMTKLVEDASAELRLEMCRSQRENEALKSKLLVMEGQLRTARGYGEGTPGGSINIAFEVKVCDEFREAQNSKVGGEGSVVAVERVFDERLSTGPAKDEQYVPMENNKTAPGALDIKYEPVGGEQDWSGSVLLTEDWLEKDPKMSQSKAVQTFLKETICGSSGAAAANGGEGPLCKEEEELQMQPCPAGDPEEGLRAELKQEPEGEPLTAGHPLLGSAEGLEVQWAWSKATRSGNVREMLRHHRGGSEHGGVRSNNRFSPRNFRASRRLHSEKNEGPTSHLEQQQNGRGPPDGISTEMSHQSVRTGEKPHSCNKCGKSFTNLHVLKRHQRIHTGEKPHSCNECGKSFSQLCHLKSHQRVHTGEKPYICVECGKSFAQLCNLKYHQSVHTGEKPYSCDECGKSFAHLYHLKSHQIVHTGEKPHSCDECAKSFAHLCNLKTHQRVHTGEKPHSCALCGKSFSQNHVLQKHILTHS